MVVLQTHFIVPLALIQMFLCLLAKANDWKKFKKLSRKEKNYEKWKISTGRTYQKQRLIKGFGLFLKTIIWDNYWF